MHGEAKPWDILKVPEGTILQQVGSRKGSLGVHSAEMGKSIPLPTTQLLAAHHELLLGVGITTATAPGKQIVTPGTRLDPPKQCESPVSCKHSRGRFPALSPAQPRAGLAGFGSSSGAGLVRHAVSAAAQPPSPVMVSRGETIYG